MVFNQPVVYELKNAGADHAVHRPEGPHRDRPRPGAACGEGDAGQLSGAGQSGGRGDSGATLVEFAELGHSPQVQDPKQFNAALLKALKSH
jgi:pimeloyl-ACP methyl ester carboxylesterase